jgi:serine/threonine-protein kinase HipA
VIRLDVWLTLPDASRLRAGELVCGDPDGQGRYPSAFRYTPEYLADPRAFALDPAGLLLREGEFTSQQLEPPLLVLEDALPDDWGRRLLVLRHGLRRGEQSAARLLQAQAGQGLGALGCFPPGRGPGPADLAPPPPPLVDLDALVDAAQRLEAGVVPGEGPGNEPDAGMAALLAAGSSPGGARPKALVRDQDGEWIAKFPSRRDEVDMVGLEAASLHLARLAGLEVPEFRVETLTTRRRVLLVRRFDQTPVGGRRHMLSLRALLQAGGFYVLRYADLIVALRQHSAQPEVDIPALYRQMVFNALLGNTDDHLKNFWLLHDEGGYRLTPAFDLLPDTGFRREHVLMFDLSPTPPGPRGLAALGRKWGVSGSAAICLAVVEGVTQFAPIARHYAVPEADIARFDGDIQHRLQRP